MSKRTPKELETFAELMRARDVAVFRLTSVANYVRAVPPDDHADDIATDDEYEAAIAAVVSAQQGILDFLAGLEKAA